jgi:hypothetical protein
MFAEESASDGEGDDNLRPSSAITGGKFKLYAQAGIGAVIGANTANSTITAEICRAGAFIFVTFKICLAAENNPVIILSPEQSLLFSVPLVPSCSSFSVVKI